MHSYDRARWAKQFQLRLAELLTTATTFTTPVYVPPFTVAAIVENNDAHREGRAVDLERLQWQNAPESVGALFVRDDDYVLPKLFGWWDHSLLGH